MTVANEEMRGAIEACAERKGAHLIDLVVRGSRGRAVVEVFIDAETGVTSDVCSEVSREIADAIDQAAWVTGSYRLDVSSPGIDRPLRFPWQYRKHVGRKLSVAWSTAEGTRQITGTLVSADDARIAIDPGKGQAGVTIEFDALTEGIVTTPW
jgi:ribosome maturation factor RimP